MQWTTSITITEPSVLSASASSTSILCHGGTSTVTVTAAGGTTPYQGTGNFNRTAGTYSFTVTDANGCMATKSITITEPSVLSASATSTTILCNGGTSTVSVTATGGTSPYQGTGNFNRTAGTYSFTVTDANGCMATKSITITEPLLFDVFADASPILCNGGMSTVTLTGQGGTSPYHYANSFFDIFTEISLPAGPYSFTVTDAHNCIASTQITVTQPSFFDVFADASPILCNGGL
ncbi:MAG: hypothetical protein NTW49_10960, partial [Bacteroidia bacterium]|nr:hypothetical protein [Bacteroidia bacterium]